jgi:hypothetical protein
LARHQTPHTEISAAVVVATIPTTATTTIAMARAALRNTSALVI